MLSLTTNAVTVIRAILMDIPAMLLTNRFHVPDAAAIEAVDGELGGLGPAARTWLGDTVPIEPFRLWPKGLHAFMEPLLKGNGYLDAIARRELLDEEGVVSGLEALLHDPAARDRLAQDRARYVAATGPATWRRSRRCRRRTRCSPPPGGRACRRGPCEGMPVMKTPVRIGLHGHGWWAQRFLLPPLLASDEVEVRAVCGRDAGRAAAAARENGIPESFDDLDTMLEKTELDALLIGSSPAAHPAAVAAAARRGLHVFCEKPLAGNAEDTARMVRECAGVRTMVGFAQRWHPGIGTLRRLVVEGDIGEVRHLRYVAFLARRIDGVLHVLLRTTVEPGCRDTAELGPTVRANPHDHLASDRPDEVPPYLRYVLDAPRERIRYDVVQSEEGGRFHHARNRYVVVEVDDAFPAEVPPDFRWAPLG